MNAPPTVERRMRWLWRASVVCVLLAGCGGTRSDLAKVTGQVKLDGQPLAGAQVQFVPLGGKGVVSLGRTDDQGRYEQSASRSADGAAVGVNQVKITTYESEDNGGKLSPVPERVPTKYNTTTELTITVKAGSNQFDFDLKSAGGKVVQESAKRLQ